MPDRDHDWVLDGFLERLDSRIELEQPPDEIRLLVTAWIMTRLDDPYQGVKRESGFDNLWFGPVPASIHGGGVIVVRSCWISEQNRQLRCDSFASLGWPV